MERNRSEKKQKWKLQKRRKKAVMAVMLSILLLFQTGTAFAVNGTANRNETAGEVIAATVSGNRQSEEEEASFSDSILEGNGTVSENLTSESEEVEEIISDKEEHTAEDTVSGQRTFQKSRQETVTGPANPVHHCTKKDGDSDYTDFNYIYFGSYPQSEVMDRATIEAIDKAIATSGIPADAGVDVWVNGAKYRRIRKSSDTNSDEYFDDVPNKNGYRYFKWERIKWKVLQNDGKTLFVVADRVMDCKDYNENWEDITWETSTIRDWLNTSFYNTAFSGSEKGAIEAQTVTNEDNPEYGTAGGNNTNDKIYFLSIGEVTNERFGFCSDYSTQSASRRMKASDYAHARGAYISNNDSYKDSCYWWLRSPGSDSSFAANVYTFGDVKRSGDIIMIYCNGVCPALHINLSSALWSLKDDGASGDGGEEKIPVSLQVTKGKTVYYVGEPLNVDDLKVTAAYQQHPAEELKPGKYTTNASEINMDTAGQKTLTVSHISGGATSTASVTITVKAITKLSVTGPSQKLAAGKKVKLTLKTTPKEAPAGAVEWKSSNKKYSIKLKAPKKTLKTGKSMTMKATVKTTGKNANKTLNWTSSNKKYATVNSKGKVTAKKAGKGKTVTITAKSTDGSNKNATVKIKIK